MAFRYVIQTRQNKPVASALLMLSRLQAVFTRQLDAQHSRPASEPLPPVRSLGRSLLHAPTRFAPVLLTTTWCKTSPNHLLLDWSRARELCASALSRRHSLTSLSPACLPHTMKGDLCWTPSRRSQPRRNARGRVTSAPASAKCTQAHARETTLKRGTQDADTAWDFLRAMYADPEENPRLHPFAKQWLQG